MNLLFVVFGCHKCLAAETSTLKINKKLPNSEKIQIIDIDSGDTRIEKLRTVWGGERSEWYLPTLILEHEGIVNTYEGYQLETASRTVIVGMLIQQHYDTLLKNLKKEQIVI